MPKYDSVRKTIRNRRIAKFALRHPELSLKEIAQHFHKTNGEPLSLSAVSLILRDQGVCRRTGKILAKNA